MATHRAIRNIKASRQAHAELFRLQADNEAKAWSGLSDQTPVRKKNLPHSEQSELLENAVGGDIQMASEVLQALSSPNQDRRRGMQAAIHAHHSALLWRYLLNFLAFQTWQDAFNHIGLAPTREDRHPIEVSCVGAGKDLSLQAILDCLQSVAEVFALDDSHAEAILKQEILQQVLAVSAGTPPGLRIFQVQRRRLIRFAAAYVCGLRADASVIPLLEEMLDDASLAWKLRSVQALGAIRDQRCCPALLKALGSGIHPLHQEASRTLNAMGILARSCWEQALQHPDSHIRWHAARGLGQIGDVRSLDVLVEGLYDDNQAVRWATASVLAKLDSTAIPAILVMITQRPLTEVSRQAVYHVFEAMPSCLTRDYIRPLLLALENPAAYREVPRLAQNMLLEWRHNQPVKVERSPK